MEEQKKTYSFVDKRGENKPEEPAAIKEQKTVEETQAQQPPRADNAKQERKFGGEIPSIDLSTLVMSFATSAIVAMGKAPDPHTGQVIKDLMIAQQNIDIISLLQEKTKGNRSREEDNLFEGVLYELRMLFVEVRKGGVQ
jgi:hypothetical protein